MLAAFSRGVARFDGFELLTLLTDRDRIDLCSNEERSFSSFRGVVMSRKELTNDSADSNS